jgi:hypothetical protein
LFGWQHIFYFVVDSRVKYDSSKVKINQIVIILT